MKVLIYSDVHGNLPAFQKMLQTEKECSIHICLGDLVNYGPWSNECVDLAESLPNSVLLIGNHEEAFIKGVYPGSNLLVKEFFDLTIKDFKRFNIIETFKKEYQLEKFRCMHTINCKYIYPDTSIDLYDSYMIGHSHHQFAYYNNNFVLYNAGSVGQNRTYINVANYLVYNTQTEEVQLKYIVYDLNVLIKEMKARNYSDNCLNYYLQKKQYHE